MRRFFPILLVLVLILPATALAMDATKAIDQARNSLGSGNLAGTIKYLKEALELVWNQAPLTVENIHFVTAEPEGYGQYTPRENNAFNGLDPIQLYMEPVGCTVKKTNGLYRMALSYDFSVLNTAGETLGGQKNIEGLKNETRTFSPEVMLSLTFNVQGLPAGGYKLVITLHDGNSPKTATVEKDFVIR